ncbi:MAG: helix-hairpin-helix domain-containing protein [Peptostreptococcaceae bacterium]|nr:helix-hairpin-helix domain-containing protein [Peptostreptococcaceae bacterium]
MKFRQDKNLVIAVSLSIALLIAIAYNIYSERREYVISATEGKTDAEVLREKEEIAFEEWMQESPGIKTPEEISETVTVYVSGAVKEAKVLTLQNGKRLVDAVELCGGLTEEADLNRANLSLKLKEEGHYVIPRIGESSPSPGNPILPREGSSGEGLLNINTATSEQLQTLPGIGKVLAERILEKRTETGGFQSAEDLLSVSGIGEKKFEDIKEKIRVE